MTVTFRKRERQAAESGAAADGGEPS